MNKKASLTFSNTQKWDRELKGILKTYSAYHKSFVKQLNIKYKTFYKNDSKDTKEELKHLIDLQKSRTEYDVHDIKNEESLEYMMIHRFKMSVDEIYNINIFIEYILHPIILHIKHKNNRVRPSYLTTKLKPCIQNPGHPSYPSGHSMQAYMIAHILSDKYPHKKAKLFLIADKIAKNREIAGVHYSSDTEYGKYLAGKLFILFKQNKLFANI